MEKEKLLNVWSGLTQKYTRNEELIHDTFEKICNAYSEDHRFYHTLQHLSHFIENVIPYLKGDSKRDIILFSAFYHDIVYNPMRVDNEEKSAQMARMDLKEFGLSRTDRILIMDYIRQTAHHAHSVNSKDYDLCLFLDADIKILSEDIERYIVYKEQLREEYKRIPTMIFNQKRIAFLKRILANKHVYNTMEFIRLFDKKAKNNILWEINELKSNL